MRKFLALPGRKEGHPALSGGWMSFFVEGNEFFPKLFWGDFLIQFKLLNKIAAGGKPGLHGDVRDAEICGGQQKLRF